MSGRSPVSRSSSLKRAAALAALALSASAHAREQGARLPNLFVGAGAIAHQLFKTTGSRTGSVTPVASVEPEIHAAFRIPIGESWAFRPSVAFTALGRDTLDSEDDASTTVRLMPIGLEFVKTLGKVDLLAGPGILVTFISGDGGTVRLNNGTSTSTFARPGGTSSSAILYLSAGAGLPVMDKVRVDGTFLLQSMMSDRRTFSFMGQVSYEVF